MANAPSLDTQLTPLVGDARPLREWITSFHLASVVIDPYTNESSWILKTASRIMHQFADSAALREQLYRAYVTRASEFGKPEWDNSPLITEILQLRREQAGKGSLAIAVAPQRRAPVIGIGPQI